METILDCAVILDENGQKRIIEAVKDGPFFFIRYCSATQEDRSCYTASLAELSLWWLRLVGEHVEVGQ